MSELPEAVANGQVNWCFMFLRDLWKGFLVVSWSHSACQEPISRTWWKFWYLTHPNFNKYPLNIVHLFWRFPWFEITLLGNLSLKPGLHISRKDRMSFKNVSNSRLATEDELKEAEKCNKNPKFGSHKISSFVIKKPWLLWDLTYFNKVKFSRSFRSCSKNWIIKQDGRFIAIATKDLQTLNLKFDQVMFNSLVFTW